MFNKCLGGDANRKKTKFVAEFNSGGGMDSFIWLVLSWTIVGTLCYLFINKLDSNRQPGTAERELKSNGTTSSTNLYSSTIP